MLPRGTSSNNLMAIIDCNGLQQYGWQGASASERLAPYARDELTRRWSAFGWDVVDIDGHDMREIVTTLEALRPRRQPVAIVSHSVKGKGVSFMETDFRWHTAVPSDDELAAALSELVDTKTPTNRQGQ